MPKREPGQPTLIVEDGVLVFTGEVTSDLERIVQRDRDERVKKLARRSFKTHRPRAKDQGKRGATAKQRPERD